MSTKRANLRDVAREAGVSYQTVSRVINDQGNVSPGTRLRVKKAIEKLDYRVNRAAQIMQTKRSNTIEVILFYSGFNLFLYEMARTTQKAGYHFVVSAVTDEEFEKTLENASSRFIDGLIFMPEKPFTQDYHELSRLCNGIPFVLVGAKLGDNMPSVLYDQKHGAFLATKHLIDLGHTQIAEISGPLKNHDGGDRHEAWVETMRDHGLSPNLSIEGDYSIESGYRAMKALLDTGEHFTAVFIGNDSMAIGAQTA
jgi:LacI family transcriptional regulator